MTTEISTPRIYASRRDERRSNAFIRELEEQDRADNSGGLVTLGFLDRLKKRGEHATQVMGWLRAEKCPGCGYGTEEATTCSSHGDATLFEGADMCKHSSRAAVEKREAELTQERLQRLLLSGCGDPDARRVVPAARPGKPPVPDAQHFPAGRRAELMYGPTTANQATERFMSDRRWLTLVLKGLNGVGKTIAAAHAVACEGGESAWIQASQYDNFARIKEVGEKAQWCDLLVVDELGTEAEANVAGVGTSELNNLLLFRRNAGRRTIVTTNMTDEQLASRYRGRWVDRLEQDGLIAACGETSLRKYVRAA